jgi:hypothetical protein
MSDSILEMISFKNYIKKEDSMVLMVIIALVKVITRVLRLVPLRAFIRRTVRSFANLTDFMVLS